MTRKNAKIFLDSVLIELDSIHGCISDTDFDAPFCEAVNLLKLIMKRL